MAKILMPKATAVWLIDNTTLTFEQIAEFCELHPLEVNGIADGEVADTGFEADGQSRYVILSHEGGYRTGYHNLGSVEVIGGSSVVQGESLGLSLEPYLFFSIEQLGIPLDPEQFF